MFRFILTVAILCVCASRGKSQLISETDINEKLVDTFIVLDQLSECYCCRGTGTYSSIQEGGPKVKNLFIVAAKSPGFEFHSWGHQVVEGSNGPTILMWHDALRDLNSRKNRFKISTGDGTRTRSKDQQIETKEQLEKDASLVWNWPELDPFGLVFGSEDRLQRRESSLTRARRIAFEYSFSKGSVLANRNLVGEWKYPDGTATMTIEFDREHGDLPKSYKWERIQDNKKKILLGHTIVSWVKYPIGDKLSFVPSTIKITTERSDGQIVDIDLSWEWLPYDIWEKRKPDFGRLFDSSVDNLRKPFVDLFEEAKSKKAPR